MIRILAITLAASALIGSATAQDFQAAPEPIPADLRARVTVPSPVEIIGMIRDFFTADNPLQMLNPFAPRSYGTGRHNLSTDSATGTPLPNTGVKIIGIEW